MKEGQLYVNTDPVILYEDFTSAVWDAQSVCADDYDGPLRCRQLAAFLNKETVFCESGKYFLVLDATYLHGNFYDAVEVLIDNQRGWIVKRDFDRLTAAK